MEKTTQALLTGPGQPVRCDAPPINDLPPQQTKVDATHICAAPQDQPSSMIVLFVVCSA